MSKRRRGDRPKLSVRIPHPGERFEPSNVCFTFEVERRTPAAEPLEEGAEVFGVITRGAEPGVLICAATGAVGFAPAELVDIIIASVEAVDQEGKLTGRVVEKGAGLTRVEVSFMTRHVKDEAELISLLDPGQGDAAGQLGRARASLMRVYENFMGGEKVTPFEARGREDGHADLVLKTPRGFKPAATMVIPWPHPAAQLAVSRQAAAGGAAR